jgi:hypothetical protein
LSRAGLGTVRWRGEPPNLIQEAPIPALFSLVRVNEALEDPARLVLDL